MGRGTIRRVYELDRMIRFGKMSSAEAAASELGVTRRTVERDLEQLRLEFGAQIVYDRRQGRYRYEGNSVTLPAQWLSEADLAILLIAERALRVYTGTSFHGAIHPAFNRLLEPVRTDRKMMNHIRDLCGCVYFSPPENPGPDLHKSFKTVLDAIMERRCLRLSNGIFEPYTLVHDGKEWVVLAAARVTGKIVKIRLSSMESPAVTEHYFHKPAKFDAEAYMKS